MSEPKWAEPSGSPFSPGFGATPRSLVGRDALLHDLAVGLASGPLSSPGYTSVLTGNRGSGKTVLLNEIEDRAAAQGWVVISTDGGTLGLPERISNLIAQAPFSNETPGLDAEPPAQRVLHKSFGLRLGPLESRLATSQTWATAAPSDLRGQLTRLAGVASANDTSVLLTLDEMHGVPLAEARELANVLQHITYRAGLPLAFIGTGLPEIGRAVMRDRRVTFFHRCKRYEIPPLNFADASKGIATSVAGAGGTIEPEALTAAADAVAGSPYRLQLIGDHAWVTSGAPHRSIELGHVASAVAVADEITDRHVSTLAWRDLSEVDQTVLKALVDNGSGNGDGTSVRRIAEGTGLTGKQTSALLNWLKESGYVEPVSIGVFRLSGLVPARVIERETMHEPAEDEPASDATAAANPPRPTCGKMMPRAKARCVLPAGHSGRCRSI